MWNSDLADCAAVVIVIDLASVLVIRTGVDVDNRWDKTAFDVFLVVLNAAGCRVGVLVRCGSEPLSICSHTDDNS